MNSMGKMLRAARKEKGLTIEQLAKQAQCSRSTIIKLETDGRNKAIWRFYKIVKALGRTMDEMMPEDGKTASAGGFDDDEIPFD